MKQRHVAEPPRDIKSHEIKEVHRTVPQFNWKIHCSQNLDEHNILKRSLLVVEFDGGAIYFFATGVLTGPMLGLWGSNK